MHAAIHRALLAPSLLTLLIVAGCSTPVFYHTDPSRHVVVLDNQPVSVLKTHKNEWEAWGGGSGGTSTDGSGQINAQFERQIKAIELVSGCRAISSVIDPDDARKLTATVQCPSDFDDD